MLITDHIYKGKIYTPEAFSVFLRMEGMRAAVVIMGSGRGLAQGGGVGGYRHVQKRILSLPTQ